MDMAEREQVEKRFAAERFKVREHFEGIPLLAYNITFDGKMADVNGVAVRTLGYARKEELLGKSIFSTVYAPASRQKAKSLFERWKHRGTLCNEKLQIVTKEGRTIDVLLNAVTIFDENGRPAHSLSTHLDITQLKQTQMWLEQSEDRYRQLVETAEEGVWLVDREWKTIFANPRMEQMLGCPPGGMLGRHIEEFMDDAGKSAARPFMAERERSIRCTHEFRFVRQDGSYLYALVASNAIPSESGVFFGALAMVTDLSEVKDTEHRLDVNRTFLKTALDSFPGNVAILDEQGRIVMTNNSWTAFGQANGLAPEFFEPGVNYVDISRSAKGPWSEGANEVCEAIEAILAGKQHDFKTEYPCHSPNENRWFELRAQGFSCDDRHWAVVTHTDVTERKELELNRELSIEVLAILNRAGNRMEIIRDVLALVKARFDFTAVAIRLREGDDYSYFVQDGFSDDFVQKESLLCVRTPEGDLVRDDEGRPPLECMCGNVLQGRVDPSQPFFTKGGSFWMNETTELLATTSEKDRHGTTRNRCNREGYESVALIPLRSGDQIIGLLQMNDSRPGRFTEEMIGFLEHLGTSIGVAFSHRAAEEALRASEERFHAMFESSPIAVWEEDFSEVKARFDELRRSGVTDFRDYLDKNPAEIANLAARVRVLAINQMSVHVLGAGSKEEVLHELPHYFTPGSLEVFKNEAVALAEGRTCFRSESPHLNARGEPLVFDLTLCVQPGYENTLSRVLVSFVDITERTQAQEALRVSEEKYRSLVENLNDVIFTVDAEGIITYLSPSVRQLTGYAPDELVGHPFREIICSEDLPGLEGSFRDTLENRLEPWQFRYHTKDGQVRWARTSSRPISADSAIAGIRGVFSDITEHKQAEQALRESEAKFRALFEHMAAGSCLDEVIFEGGKAVDYRILDINPSFERLTGISKARAVGALASQLYGTKEVPFLDIYAKVAETGEPTSFEAFFPPLDKHLYITASCPGEGMFSTVFSDITARKQAEERLLDYQQHLRFLTAELAMVEERERRRIGLGLHDNIAQGLAMMKLALQTLGMTTDEETANALSRRCSDIDGLVDEIRSLSFELTNSVLYEIGLCEAIEAHLEQTIRSKHGLAYDLQTSGDFSVLDTDVKGALFRSFRELAANVVKHAQAKNVHVRLECAADRVTLEIEDDGRGSGDMLSMEHRADHFGLSSIREQMTVFGGSIEILSESGHGTCVTVTSPVRYAARL